MFRNGEVQEHGDTADIVRTPQHAYTRQLLSDLQGQRLTIAPVAGLPLASPAIRARAISKRFSLGKGHQLQALDRVTFDVRRGSTHALVGESGSGKTTLARILLGFEQAGSGQVIIDDIDATDLSREARRQLRQKIQFVYQNPFASRPASDAVRDHRRAPEELFSPRQGGAKGPGGDRGAAGCPARRTPDPHRKGAFRRTAPARSHRPGADPEPTILVLDEATSALDVTVRAQILALLQQLQQQLGLTYLFITHDLSTVRRIAHSVTVLRSGQVVEHGDVETLFTSPQNDYTRELIAAIPHFSPATEEFA